MMTELHAQQPQRGIAIISGARTVALCVRLASLLLLLLLQVLILPHEEVIASHGGRRTPRRSYVQRQLAGVLRDKAGAG